MDKYPAHLVRTIHSVPPLADKDCVPCAPDVIQRLVHLDAQFVGNPQNLSFDQLMNQSPLVAMIAVYRMMKPLCVIP